MSPRALVRSGLLVTLGLAGVAGVLWWVAGKTGSSSDASHAVGASGKRPHVVMVVIDTLRADKVGCYGAPWDSSPELDRFAEQGVQFSEVVAQSSWTRPSFGSFLTSRYPRTVGLYKEKGDILPDRFETLAEVLEQSGYRTLGATANANINSAFNFHQGFDYYLDSHVVWRFMKAGEDQKSVNESTLPGARDRFRALLEHLDGESERVSHEPHFLMAVIMEVHEKHRDKMFRPRFREKFRGKANDPLEAKYLRAVRQSSHDISWFVDRLLERPAWEDNTLFVFVSDHGEGLRTHPHVPRSRKHGHLLYESQVLVPMIFYDTSGRLPEGRRVERRVRLLDLMPTLLGYLGIEERPRMTGTSLMPLIEDPEADVGLSDSFVVETQFRENDKTGLYAGKWQYFHNRDGHPNTRTHALHRFGPKDDGHRTDVGKEHPEVLARLRSRLEAWEKEHPRVESTHRDEGTPEQVKEQLRSLGYAQ